MRGPWCEVWYWLDGVHAQNGHEHWTDPNQDYGGLKILLLFGDDGQLPPVTASRLFSDKAQTSNAGQAGQLQYSMIKRYIFLTDVVRQRGDPHAVPDGMNLV